MITSAKNKEPFFFSGGMEYEPVTVHASSRDEAEQEWTKVRRPVKPADESPQEPEAGEITTKNT